MNKKKGLNKGLKISTKREIAGYCFTAPFIIGFILFFLYPLILSIQYSFSRIELVKGGYRLINVGFAHYYRALFVHPDFVRSLTEAITQMIYTVPMIIIFSFFAAVLLNQKFKGRVLARSIFFLPVIITSGVIAAMESGDLLVSELGMISTTQEVQIAGNFLQAVQMRDMLMNTKLPPQLVDYVISAIEQIYNVVISSGVQILIFLAGLQSIPSHLFEASNLEGATAWENFWKITFPMLSPLILVCTLYSIIDTFTQPTNPIMELLDTTAFVQGDYGFSSAIAWIYFIVIMIIIGIVIYLISKMVFYQE